MKKILTVVFLLCLLFMAGCGKNEEKPGENKAVQALEASSARAQAFYSAEELSLPEGIAANVLFGFTECGGSFVFAGSSMEGTQLYAVSADTAGISRLEHYGGEELAALCASSDGELCALYWQEESCPCFVRLRETGEEESRVELSDEQLPENWRPMRMLSDRKNLYLVGDELLAVFETGRKPKLLYTLEAETGAQLAALSDGCCALCQNGKEGYTIQLIDDKQETYGSTLHFDMPFSVCGRGETGLYLSDGSSLYTLDFYSGELMKLLDWASTGVYGGAVAELSGCRLLCMGVGPNVGKLYILEKKEGPESASEPVVLTLATIDTLGLPYYMQEAVLEWNGSHPDCKIEIKNYNIGEDPEAVENAKKRLILDITAGEIPDMYDFSFPGMGTPLDAAMFARKGMLENLYPYIDRDEGMSRESFLPNVLSALEINNGLYELVPWFRVVTAMGYGPDLGPPENWTYDALNAVVTEKENYKTLFNNDGTTRNGLLSNIVFSSGSKLVDWKKGDCYFDSDYFVDILETTLQISDPPGERLYGSYSGIVSQSPSLLYISSFGSEVWGEAVTANSVYGQNSAFVGFPELGPVIVPQFSLGISAYSAHKEECWQFLRQYLAERPLSMPHVTCIRKDVMDSSVRYWVDRASGKYSEIDKEPYIQNHPGIEDTMKKYLDHIYSAETVYRFDQNIWEIVWSEATKFYGGQYTAAQAAAAIQGRASVYMAEQSE